MDARDGANPSVHAGLPGAELLPVEGLAYDVAVEGLARVDLVLPTEARWEYGARAGTDGPWWWGAEPPLVWQRVVHMGFDAPAHVGSLPPNGFGLHDVLGNLAERCLDAPGSYADPVRPGTGERLSAASEPGQHVYRGGSYRFGGDTIESFSRVSFRAHAQDSAAEAWVGVRPARGLR